jgi:HPt (histidine-containing phosphotransfer) domain-containing protein
LSCSRVAWALKSGPSVLRHPVVLRVGFRRAPVTGRPPTHPLAAAHVTVDVTESGLFQPNEEARLHRNPRPAHGPETDPRLTSVPDLDLVHLADVTCNDATMEHELLDLFLVHTRELLASSGVAIMARETGLLKGYAHALKGGSRTIGAMALGDLAEDIERLAEASDLTASLAALHQAEAAFERVSLIAGERRLRPAA